MRSSVIGRTTLIVASLAIAHEGAAVAPLGTAFTYQGKLESSGSPVTGTADFQFTLWDAASGVSQVAGPVAANNVSVANGLFTTTIDFGPGAAAFNGDARWLEVAARTPAGSGSFITLTPRQALTAAPNALFALNAAGLDGLDSTAFLQSIPVPLTLSGASITHIIRAENTSTGFLPIAVFGRCSGASGNGATGVRGESASNFGRGVYGEATTATGATYGGDFRSNSTSGTGVSGSATAVTGTTYGVWGQSAGSSGRGVYGQATAATGTTYGGYFQSDSTSGQGVVGYATAATGAGATRGVYGRSDSTSGRGVFGIATAISGTTYGVYGESYSPDGYAGYFVGDQNYFEGNVGIGTLTPERALDVVGRIRLRQDTPPSGGNSAGIDFYQQTPAEDRAFIGMRNDDQIGLYGRAGSGWSFVMDVATGNVGIGTTTPQAKLEVNGTVRVDVLEIAGADLAEKFPVSEEVKPGMVVMIDANNAGKLCLSSGAYNKSVAGIVSGANGLAAGTILGHLPGNEDAPPIALSGRVWVHCDATDHAIEVGDMLTTSNTPGHAMAAADTTKCMGAVIGKAMTALPDGEKGLVLVLVNLQ